MPNYCCFCISCHVDRRGSDKAHCYERGEVTAHVTQLIGAFYLDPNRVLDLTLDAVEFHLSSAATNKAGAATTSSGAGPSNTSATSTTSLSSIVPSNISWHHCPAIARAIHMLLEVLRSFSVPSITLFNRLQIRRLSYYNEH